MNIRETGRLLRAGKLSCVELLADTLSAIHARERFNSFITLTEDLARAQASERDAELARGFDRGPLHGIPTAYKDLFYTAGIRTTGGSLIYRDFIPTEDATVVARLHDAGAICLGKTNLHELAYGITSKNPHYGFVLNPCDPTRIAGGSSGGSAALMAAGFIPFSPGTDTGGSIRIPASFCGIAGLKPTYGLVSRHGVLPLAFSLDHVGLLGSCVDDCALALNAIAGPDPLDGSCNPDLPAVFDLPPVPSLAGVRVGVPTSFFFDRIDSEVESAVRRAIQTMETLGASIIEAQLPDMKEVFAASRIVQLSETSSLYEHHTDPARFGADVWALIQQGKKIPAHEYVRAQQARVLFRRRFDDLWTRIDVLATPTTPMPAPRIDQDSVQIAGESEEVRAAATRFVRAINYLGEPALSLSCGHNSEGLPIGLQLIAAPFADARLLQIARALEPALI